MTQQNEYNANNALYRYTGYDYAPNTTNWLLNLPYRQTTRDASGNRIAETLFYYDGASSLNTPPQKGDLTAQRNWVEDTTYVATNFSSYDVYGNAHESKSYAGYGNSSSGELGGARVITTAYDEHGLLPIQVTGPLLPPSVTSYDYRFQLPLTETDPNNATTTYSYDGFGRLISVKLPLCNDNTNPPFRAEYPTAQTYDATSPYRETVQQRLDSCTGGSAPEYATTHVY